MQPSLTQLFRPRGRERFAAPPSFSEQWDIAFVGEESSQNVPDTIPERMLKPYYWCVDPLDGTLPFVEGLPREALWVR